jgi:hypothetical protein
MGLDWITSFYVLKYFSFSWFLEVFLARFHSCNLNSLSSIYSMGKVAQMSLNKCPQCWGNLMSLSPSIERFLEFISKPYVSWVNPKFKGKSLDLEMYSLCWGDPCVQVSSNLVPYSSRIKIGKKVLNIGKFSEWTGQVRYLDQTSPSDSQQQPLITVLSVIC